MRWKKYEHENRTVHTTPADDISAGTGGVSKAKNLFNNPNIMESANNPILLGTVYALGRVNMILTSREHRTVQIVNDKATDYDWNIGGGFKRDTFIRINNTLFNINPQIHGFKTYYYGVGTLRR